MENAIILASGLGSRMRPLTYDTPKPLLKVHGTPMIETVIGALLHRGVDNIFVVVGYLKEQFLYLQEKFSNVQLLVNDQYEHINNISSLMVAEHVLGNGDCFICEADLFVADEMVCCVELDKSCYFGKYVCGKSDDWVLEQNLDGWISRVGKCGQDCYNMAGIAYFKAQEAGILRSALHEVYDIGGYEDWFWDDVVNMNLYRLPLVVHKILDEQVIEIDTLGELEFVNREILSD